MTEHTRTPWAMECVSDACRIIVGKGRQKWILARLATKQIPETEVASNARLIVRAVNNFQPLLEALQFARKRLLTAGHPDVDFIDQAIRNAEKDEA